jgi:putative heme-binding domain-containing protein
MQALFAKFPAETQAGAESLLARLAPNDVGRSAQLEQIVSGESGNAARGEELFFSQRAACSACHRVGNRGERIGPELTKVGQIRARRDLAEAILFPGASLVRGFESFRLVTNAGQVHAGLLTRETSSAVHLRTAERQEIVVPRDEIEELVPSPVSIMPQGLDKILSSSELRDVIAYLQSLK